MGIYEREVVGTPDLPDGGALLAETGAVTPTLIHLALATITPVQLDPELYFFALHPNRPTTMTFCGWNTRFELDGDGAPRYFSRTFAQAFGAFTNPCPVTTAQYDTPWIFLRVISIP